jgi:DNA adenine methylase
MDHPLSAAALAHFDELFPMEAHNLTAQADCPTAQSIGNRSFRIPTIYKDIVVSGSPRLPHAIPYQGSKRTLAPLIAPFVPPNIRTWFEPFAGSAAMTIYAAHHALADRFVIADSLEPMVDLWRAIIGEPDRVAAEYAALWSGQEPGDHGYFNRVRERYNKDGDPVELLYLICRCVKNAVRFNANGRFTQSVDKRRLGMRPDKMKVSVAALSHMLRGKVEFRTGDWLETTADATPEDFLYMDPPYVGTSVGRDKRYHAQLTQVQVIQGLEAMLERDLRFALSYDGKTGDKTYSAPMPERLGLTHLFLHAGASSQATLAGRPAQTIESLYLSPGLGKPVAGVIRRYNPMQERLFA